MFVWPDGTVTGSPQWDELEGIVARKDDESVTKAGWDALALLLAERGRGPAEAVETAADPEPTVEDGAPASHPAKNDNKAAWVDHAVSQGADRDEAESLTKAELVELYTSQEDS
jgi:hypothetical protein